MALPPVIQVEGLVCHAAGRAVLDIQALQITAGERVAIVGHNGAGKSTLLRVLSGFVQPSHGRVVVLGREFGATRRLSASALRGLRTEVGQVMQGLHLVQRLTAQENVLIGALGGQPGWRSWVRWPTAAEREAADRALSAVGLLAKAGQRADRLSGGERQKTAIARMLMQRPLLIFADEPTAALDPLAASEVCTLLARAAAGATLLTVVHNPSLLPLLADRVIGLKQGRVAFDVPVADAGDALLARLYRPDDDAARLPMDAHTLHVNTTP